MYRTLFHVPNFAEIRVLLFFEQLLQILPVVFTLGKESSISTFAKALLQLFINHLLCSSLNRRAASLVLLLVFPRQSEH